jgi:phosphonopyruvate decarboxylase
VAGSDAAAPLGELGELRMTMRRDDCLRVLAEHIPEEIVVAVYSTAFDWLSIRPHALNFTSVGAMGLASSHGLGLALARPDRKVIVLDRDGSLLMNLGSLVTIGATAPQNLYHFVSNNGVYETNGSHPLPSPNVRFADHARAAGYKHVFEFSTLDDFKAQIGKVMAATGPVFILLNVVRGMESKQDFQALYSPEARAAFKAKLAETGAAHS